jgi:hypothetical protein
MDSKLMQYFQTAEEGLAKGFRANLKIGPKLYSEEERELLIKLMNNYPDSFDLIILAERPRHQHMRIGHDNIELIVPHEICQNDIKSLCLSMPKEYIANKLNGIYDQYEGKPASVDDIRAMKLYKC